MTATLPCPNCGAPLPAASPQSVCPSCLLRIGLDSASASEALTGADAVTGDFDPGVAATIDQVASSTRSVAAMVQRMPEPGERIGGYHIVRMLGKGGMGAIYEAEENDTGRRVALKLLKQSLDSPEARKRFLLEGRVAASVNH